MATVPPEKERELGLGELDGFRLERVLGEGLGGITYCAVRVRDDRRVALKVAGGGDAPEAARARARLQREVALLGELQHPALLSLVEAGGAATTQWLATPLLEGGDLAAWLRRQGRLEPQRLLDAGTRLAGALATLHARDLVHRDVKPANILLDGEGHAYLGDLGAARGEGPAGDGPTRTGGVVGTPAYMSPEALRGAPPSPPADVYSLGLTLVEAATGQRLPVGPDGPERSLPRLAALPPEVAGALRRCLRVDPAHRPTAAALAGTLEGMSGRNPETRPPRASPRLLALCAATVALGWLCIGPSGSTAPRDLRWQVVGDALVVEGRRAGPGALALEVPGAPPTRLSRSSSGAFRLVVRGLPAGATMEARLTWDGGRATRKVSGEPPAVADNVALGAEGLEVQVLRPVRFAASAATPAQELAPGPASLPLLGDGLPDRLVWEEGGVRFTRPLNPGALREAAARRVLGVLEGLALDDPAALPRAVRAWARLGPRLGQTLEHPGTESLELWGAWDLWHRAGRLAGRGGPSDTPLPAPAEGSGSYPYALPEGPGWTWTRVPLQAVGAAGPWPEEGIEVTSSEAMLALPGRYWRAARGVTFVVPRSSTEAARVGLALRARLQPYAELVLEWRAGDTCRLHLLPIDLAAEERREGWHVGVLPAHAAPLAGTRVEVAHRGTGNIPFVLSRIQEVQVGAWVPP